MPVKVFRNNTVFIDEVFSNGRGLFGVFSHVLVQVCQSTALHNFHHTSHIEVCKLDIVG